MRRLRRTRRRFVLGVICLVLSAPGWAFAASGSLAGSTGVADTIGDTVGDTTKPVTESTQPVTDTLLETVEPVTGTVDDVTEPVLDTTEPVTDTVKDVAEPVTDTTRDTTEPVTDTTRDTTEPVTDTIRDTTEPVTETVTDTTEPVRDTITGTTRPVTRTIGDVTRPVSDSVDDLTRAIDDGLRGALEPVREVIDDGGLLGDRPAGARTGNETGDGSRTVGDDAPPGRAAVGPGADQATKAPVQQRADSSGALTGVTLTPSPLLQGAHDAATLSDVIAGLGQASRQFSFPLTVAALVLLFLAVQGRLDARDPKLAAGREDEELMFA